MESCWGKDSEKKKSESAKTQGRQVVSPVKNPKNLILPMKNAYGFSC